MEWACPKCRRRFDSRYGYCEWCKQWVSEQAEYSAFMGYRVHPMNVFTLKRTLAAMLRREKHD